MEKAQEDIVLAIIISSIILVILSVFTTLFFLVFVRKKRIINEKKEELSRNFEKQLLETKLEIQNETLNGVSREIHDNIGQVLSFIKLSLATSVHLDTEEKNTKIIESTQLISEVISDLRDLSKSLSFEKIKEEGLVRVIMNDIERLQKSGIINAFFTLEGTPVKLSGQVDLVLYRIFQEILNNTLKHAESKDIFVDLKFAEKCFTLTIKDSGKGFCEERLDKGQGLGLKNIRQRATLIGANVVIETKPLGGCKTEITLNNASIL